MKCKIHNHVHKKQYYNHCLKIDTIVDFTVFYEYGYVFCISSSFKLLDGIG